MPTEQHFSLSKLDRIGRRGQKANVFSRQRSRIWKLTVLSALLERLVNLIPQLLTAGLILLIGWGVATAFARALHGTLVQEDFGRAGLVARSVRSAILVVTCAIALVELRVAVTLVTGAFLIAFGALALGLVLAFGLGSRDAVEKMWEGRARQIRERENAATEPGDK